MRYVIPTLALIGCEKKAEPDAYSLDCSESMSCMASDGVSACEDCDTSCTEDYIPEGEAVHIDGDIEYAEYPPTGGDHSRCWWDWGVWTEEVPEERWVHNMEHGGVIFLYNCPEGCETEVATLVDAVGSNERVIVTPYSKMDVRFAAVAWEYRILSQCLDVSQMVGFYNAHFAQGPEDVASMAPAGCMDEDTGSADTVSR
jgi:hypothetical protein